VLAVTATRWKLGVEFREDDDYCGCGCMERFAQRKRGRPRMYVDAAHKQRAFRDKKRAA
jgi:hypothetical protein